MQRTVGLSRSTTAASIGQPSSSAMTMVLPRRVTAHVEVAADLGEVPELGHGEATPTVAGRLTVELAARRRATDAGL
jgi:hypothetical protein